MSRKEIEDIKSALETVKKIMILQNNIYTRKIKQLLAETSLTTAAWNHPEHRFYTLPESLKAANKKPKRKVARSKVKVS